MPVGFTVSWKIQEERRLNEKYNNTTLPDAVFGRMRTCANALLGWLQDFPSFFFPAIEIFASNCFCRPSLPSPPPPPPPLPPPCSTFYVRFLAFLATTYTGFSRHHDAIAVRAPPPRRLAPGRCPYRAGLFHVGGALAEVRARAGVYFTAIG